MSSKWYSESQCFVCGAEAFEDERLCKECLEKLQTHYVNICIKCKHYEFFEWTEKHVRILATKLDIPFELLFETNQIVVIPFRVCPLCDTKEEGYYGWL